jgi:heme/copper-type cytochrome/quinol oxidase subunit 4
VNRRFQIVIAPRSARKNEDIHRLTSFGRFKSLLAGFVLAIVALSVLIAALILGYVIAAVVCVVLILAVAIVIVRSFFRRKRQ